MWGWQDFRCVDVARWASRKCWWPCVWILCGNIETKKWLWSNPSNTASKLSNCRGTKHKQFKQIQIYMFQGFLNMLNLCKNMLFKKLSRSVAPCIWFHIFLPQGHSDLITASMRAPWAPFASNTKGLHWMHLPFRRLCCKNKIPAVRDVNITLSDMSCSLPNQDFGETWPTFMWIYDDLQVWFCV